MKKYITTAAFLALFAFATNAQTAPAGAKEVKMKEIKVNADGTLQTDQSMGEIKSDKPMKQDNFHGTSDKKAARTEKAKNKDAKAVKATESK